MRSVERAADRFLNVFAPKITAKADPCSCGHHRCDRWGALCGQTVCGDYYWLQCCNGCHYETVGCYLRYIYC